MLENLALKSAKNELGGALTLTAESISDILTSVEVDDRYVRTGISILDNVKEEAEKQGLKDSIYVEGFIDDLLKIVKHEH